MAQMPIPTTNLPLELQHSPCSISQATGQERGSMLNSRETNTYRSKKAYLSVVVQAQMFMRSSVAG